MNTKELNDFKLSDAVKFHGTLNPVLFHDTNLRKPVRSKLLDIAKDFMDHMGLDDLQVKDILLVGSNAAYSYTPHSDIDLHIVVDLGEKENDDIYRELFASKKAIYNDKHDIKIRDFDVELYIQSSTETQKTLGEYSVLKNKWIKFPSKTKSNLDERATKEKFMKLVQLGELALRSDNLEKVDALLDTIKKYRRAGLDVYGEFGPENLAYKALRSHGIVQQLFDHRDKLHAEQLSLEENIDDEDDLSPPGLPMSDVERIQREIRRRTRDNFDLVWLSPSQIGGSHTDSELNSYGLRKSKITAKWGGTKNQWDRFFYSNKKKHDSREQELAERYQKEFEDFDPNGPPPGPEFKPTMPAGTVRVDVSDVYDWYKLGQHVSNLKGLGKHDFGKGPPSTIMAFGSEDAEHEYIDALKKTGLTTTDIDPPGGPKIKGQKVDRTYNVDRSLEEKNKRLSK